MPGAAALAARAAVRSGAGLVRIAAEPAVLPWALLAEPCATGVELWGGREALTRALAEADPGRGAVLAVGPGLGRSQAARERVLAVLGDERALVLDADGLNLLAGLMSMGEAAGVLPLAPGRRVVLTPHPGEYQRLAEALGLGGDPIARAGRQAAATALARATGAVVVLKGAGTVIAEGERLLENSTGNPALATGGSGDVLTGCIAALLAQGATAYDAAVLGCHAHGLAADRWAQVHGLRGLRGPDLADGLPGAFRELESDGGG
jgi:NAD(P)H-hydrate epimerase